MLARAVVDGYLGDPVALVVGEHRDVAMELSVEVEALEDVGSVRLQPAVHVVEPDPRNPARDRVEDLRGDASCERVAPFRLPPRDEVVALVESGEEARNLDRVVLEVAVDRHHDLAGGLLEPRVERRGLAEVPSEADGTDVVVRVVQAGQRPERSVRGAVVDEYGLPREPFARERGRQLVVEQCDASLLVVHGNDDRDHDARVPRAPGVA